LKEKILNLFNKSKYITEFLIMISFSLCLYKVITIKAYQNYWNALFIALSIITGILLIANMIYNCKKDKDKIENMFINFVIPVGILFIVFMLPTYTPDASAHIWRAYEVSTGTKFTKIAEDGSSKTTVPLILSESGENEIVTYELLENTINSEDAQDYGKTIQIDTPSKGYSNLLFEGYAVCGGYSDLMELFLERMGVKSFKVSSEHHIWNAVKIGNSWYHLDLTWDDPVANDGKDYLEYDYFLITTEKLQKNLSTGHEFDVNYYPELKGN